LPPTSPKNITATTRKQTSWREFDGTGTFYGFTGTIIERGKASESMDDRFLAEQSAKGNENAFRLLVLRYQGKVFGFLRSFIFQVQVLEDLAQETFLRAYRHLADFDVEKGASFSTWLLTIARNLAINEKAKRRRRRERAGSSMDMVQALSEEGPQDILEKRNLYSRVHDAINRLPDKFQSAMILSYFEELSIEEIAQIEKCPVGTVKSRISRGKQFLRQILEKENVL
jgi:RNA polymerase sigma-70 factor (ECF subfamily)